MICINELTDLDQFNILFFYKYPIFNQFIKLIDKKEIRKIAKNHGSEQWEKSFPLPD